MRAELERIEKIEQYLSGQLSAEDKLAFEKQIQADPQLKEEIRLQMEIMKGIERASWKQEIKKAGRKFRLQKNFKWGLGGLGIAVLLTAAFLLYRGFAMQGQEYGKNKLPELNEAGEKLWADADRNIAAQLFSIDANKDTVIETKGGIVMAIEANTFIDENGSPATGRIDFTVKEALDPATIMQGGLSTMSGDKLLESGGMFLTDARKNGNILKIDPAKGIYAEIPANNPKAGMQLFTGKRMPDGRIDWVDPKSLEKELSPVATESLDFYPPNYLDSLQRWGYDITNKAFTDSLYYSFARLFNPPKPDTSIEYINKYNGADSSYKDYNIAADTLPAAGDWFQPDCGINPAKIKAIWNRQFDNTLIATREFEERLHWIHLASDPAVLDLYVNNLDKNLSTIDTMAAMRLHPGYIQDKFMAFAARQDGRVKTGDRSFAMLSDYYEKKTRAFTAAIAKTQNEFWSKQITLDAEANRREQEHLQDSINRVAQNFNEEFSINLKEAYRQLGYDTTIPTRRSRGSYRVRVNTTGWCNVDRYVFESVAGRTTLDYTDPGTGRKAVINFKPASFTILNAKEYDQLAVYLLPDKLSSFMRVNGQEGLYTEQLNELMEYKLVCIAYKEEQTFYYWQDNVKPEEYSSINLNAVSKEELKQRLQVVGSNGQQGDDIIKEIGYFQFNIADKKRQQGNEEIRNLTMRVMRLLFECWPINK